MMKLTILILLLLVIAVQSFIFPTWMKRSISTTTYTHAMQTKSSLHAKADLFSDDIFNEEEAKKKKQEASKKVSKKNYLEEDWKIDENDAMNARALKTSKNNQVQEVKSTDDSANADIPIIGLVYIFRQEFQSANIESTLLDHKKYGQEFKRLFISQPIGTPDKRGLSMIWVGVSPTDLEETRSEITRFMAKDPLMTQNIVQSWELMNINGDEDDDDDDEGDDDDLSELFN